MTTISSSVAKLTIRSSLGDGQSKESNMSPLYSTEILSGVATKMSTAGVVTPFVGNAVLWIKEPGGTVTQNGSIACASPNGAWSFLSPNNKPGTWVATLHVPASTGYVATVSADYSWEVDSSIATAQ